MMDVIFIHNPQLGDSAEYRRGNLELRRRIQASRWWYSHGAQPIVPREALNYSSAEQLLVILEPALILSDGIQQQLSQHLPPGGCILPSDPRGHAPGVALDYANRSGFDRFVQRLQSQPPTALHDGRAPWLYLIQRQAMQDVLAERPDAGWADLPDLLAERSLICQHAFIHAYADYYQGDRQEMLQWIPPDVDQLLDVGGGQGGFAEAFMRQRQGRASLVEMSPAAAAIARAKGIEVFNQPFEQWVTEHRYDCISLLDVLEHLVEPVPALRKAHSLLRPDGYLLLSVPNVGHWSVVWDLLQGRFEYLPVGILCETHLRFYTRPSLESLLRQTGFGVLTWHNQTTACPEAFGAYLSACHASGLSIDQESLQTYSFRVLAQRQ